jgi:acyl-coenzyme A thioesterase PaaI-like protein
MPAQASITLNTKIYTPRGTQQGVSTWALAGDATFGGAVSTLTESVRGPLANGNYRTRWVLTVPKIATADSACACTGGTLGQAKADVTIDFPTSFTAAERQDFVDRWQAAVATSVFDVSVATPEGSWS